MAPRTIASLTVTENSAFRTPIWPKLLLGWLPVGALLALLVLTAHQSTTHEAVYVGARGVIAGVIV